MAILLQYNTEDSYTVQQLTDSTQIKTVSTVARRRVFTGEPEGTGLTCVCFLVFRTFWFKFCRFC